VQCAFLEIDAARCGRITERALMHWYHGHIGRELKRCANAPRRRSPARGQLHRRDSNGALVQWAQTALFDMGVYASAVCVLLITASIAATILALAHRSVLQLVINLYLSLAGLLLLVLELKVERTRRTALHIFRYASALLHPRARGMVYLLLPLLMLSQTESSLGVHYSGLVYGIAYLVEVLAIALILVGFRVDAKLRALRRQLPDRAAIVAAFLAVSPDGRPVTLFGLVMLMQSAGVPLGWRIEQHAMLGLFSLMRDGTVSESDLVFWLTSRAAEEAAEEAAEPNRPQDRRQTTTSGGGGGQRAEGSGSVTMLPAEEDSAPPRMVRGRTWDDAEV